MKILQVNKYHYPRGGADQYFLSLTNRQIKAGHEVAVFCMHHPKNLPSLWSRYFVSYLSFNKQTWIDKLKTPGRVLYSFEAKKKFSALLDDFKPDIIHLHNIYHQLSPSILDAAAKRQIPVVMHLHDYKIIAANHAMFAPPDHHCDPNNYWACLRRRCVKDSLVATSLAILEMWFHHRLLKVYERQVKIYIAPSRYMKSEVSLYSTLGDKIRVVYNPFSPELKPTAENYINQDYLLYFGRLGPEKGLKVLIEAIANQGLHLKIIGDGPERSGLENLSKDRKAKVEFRGFLSGEDLVKEIMEARAVILPSIWAENMPLSLLEAMSLGKIVIASKIGGLAEIIDNGRNGLLFKASDAQDLISTINKLNRLDLKEIGRQAKETARQYSPEKNFQQIMDIYQNLL